MAQSELSERWRHVAPTSHDLPLAGPERARWLAARSGFAYLDLSARPVDPAAATMLTEALARRHHVAPLGWHEQTALVAVAAPDDLIALDVVRVALGGAPRVLVSSLEDIDAYLERLFPHETAGDPEPATDPVEAAPAAVEPLPRDPSGTWTVLPFATLPGANDEMHLGAILAPAPDSEITTQREQLATVIPLRESPDPAEQPSPHPSRGGTGGEHEAGMPRHLARAADKEALSEEQVEVAPAPETVDLHQWTIDPLAAMLLPEAVARRHRVLAIGFDAAARPIIATADVADVVALDDVRTFLGRDISPVACGDEIDEYLSRVYRHHEETELAARNAARSTDAAEWSGGSLSAELPSVILDEAPIVKFVNLVLRQALNEHASDVHLEPTADSLQVRFRVDGVLHDVNRAPKSIGGGVVSRLKVMADLDISEHRVPQDGRMSISTGDREVDLRVATMPTVHGEKVVLRILDRSTAPLDLDRVGFLPDVLERYEPSYRKPSGTILVTGPTGSGKSTTLYATLNALNSPERNIITVEDPVEYQLAGVNQVQVNARAGLTFASALRSILRADPDIVLIGEVRDRETATIAVEAALTGHLVLSCLHTNNAASTPLRLIEMGVEPFLVASALDCVLAQRLGRLLCDHCARPSDPAPAELTAAGFDDEDTPDDGRHFRAPAGCQACGNTGYHGRVAIQEVMPITEELERAILAREQSQEIHRIALAQGMRPLRRDGLRKAALGLTSLEEIARVVA